METTQADPDTSASTATAFVRVLITDDQTLFRSGLARLLEEDPRVKVVGQAVDGADAVKQAIALKPDVVLMDIKMPNMDGVEATRKIVTELPNTRILVLTTFDADSYVLQALRAGASGYVLKNSQPAAIVSSQSGTARPGSPTGNETPSTPSPSSRPADMASTTSPA